MFRVVPVAAVVLTAGLMLSACGANRQADEVRARYEAVDLSQASQIGVNGFLWRATLDTLAFMPLKSADSSGGVIITEWYVNPDVRTERFSMTVYIKDRALRADALEVVVHRQTFSREQGWVNASTQQGTVTKIENAILTRARDLRLGTLVAGE